MADWQIKKQDLDQDLLFDLVIENNTAIEDNTYLTASLLSIFTDGSKSQIGEQIDGKTLGNKEYNLNKLSIENIKNYEKGLHDALKWLLDDKIVSSINIETEKIGNRLNVAISFLTNKGDVDNLKYSLDENLEILN